MEENWSSEQARQVETYLKNLKDKANFQASERLLKFLAFIVLEEIAGRGSEINQTSIALDVFDRGADFDPAIDSIVRVEAGRLRTKLRDYYQEEGEDDEIRIELPKGRYRPKIVFGGDEENLQGTKDSSQDIRYCQTEDGVSIAYAVSGEGPPLVKAANWLSHLEYDFATPVWNHWWKTLSQKYQLVRYDERGCGLSDWEVEDFSVDVWVRDLELVVDTLGLEKFPLLGISQGASVAISYAVKHPERVSHLILYGGFAKGSMKREPTEQERNEIEVIWDIVKVGWGKKNSAFRKFFASFFMPDGTPEQFDSFSELQRVSTSPENAERFIKAFNHIDVSSQLSKVPVSTLVMHARGDLEVPLSQSLFMAKQIPGAKLVTLESRNHILGEHEEAWSGFLDELRNFIA